MRGFIDRLAKSHTVICADLRGSGLADRDVPVHTFDAYVADIDALLDTLGVQALDVVANGFRTSVAVRYAGMRPQRVRRLMLQAVTAGPTAASGKPMVQASARALLAQDLQLWVDMVSSRSGGSEEMVAELREHVFRCTDQASLLAALDALNETYVADDPRLLKCPTLVAERRGSTLVAAGEAAAFVRQAPQAELVTLPNRPNWEWLEDFAEAIERFIGNPEVSAASPAAGGSHPLTKREAEVLQLVASGCANAEIASRLGLSTSTIDRHVANIYAKAEVRNRAEATLWAVRAGIIVPEPVHSSHQPPR
jgi:DNA-binding CsgD family transcriptional regulator/pimeloyl-ACP methyl ester carboxylesterase